MKYNKMYSVDRTYQLLENYTNEEKAKYLFEKYVLNEQILDSIDERKAKISFKSITKNEIISQIARHALVYSCVGYNDSYNQDFVDFKNHLKENNIDYDKVVDYLLDNKEELRSLIKGFVEQRYNKKYQHRMNNGYKDEDVKRYIISLDSCGKCDYKKSLTGRIRNLLVNSSRYDVFSNNQVNISHKKYSLGKELYASIDRGNDYIAQEDGVIIDEHPDYKDFKLIAVADGDSSKKHGEKASNYVLKKITKWFEGLDPYYYNKPNELRIILIKELESLNTDLLCNYEDNATTIAVALIGSSKSVISTIGDTRIYQINDGKIISETKDDSYVQLLCDKGLANPKTARFHKANDFIENSLGSLKDDSVITNNTIIVDNDFDSLLVLSDGVTKLVDNEKIEKIVKTEKEESVTESIIKIARTEDAVLDEVDCWCNKVNKAGQNNVTAAMYVKRR